MTPEIQNDGIQNEFTIQSVEKTSSKVINHVCSFAEGILSFAAGTVGIVSCYYCGEAANYLPNETGWWLLVPSLLSLGFGYKFIGTFVDIIHGDHNNQKQKVK